jgi:hypothetical protein
MLDETWERVVMKLLSPDARTERERRLAICLALIAGYVDAHIREAERDSKPILHPET